MTSYLYLFAGKKSIFSLSYLAVREDCALLSLGVAGKSEIANFMQFCVDLSLEVGRNICVLSDLMQFCIPSYLEVLLQGDDTRIEKKANFYCMVILLANSGQAQRAKPICLMP